MVSYYTTFCPQCTTWHSLLLSEGRAIWNSESTASLSLSIAFCFISGAMKN